MAPYQRFAEPPVRLECTFAGIITFGIAEEYRISISWQSKGTVSFGGKAIPTEPSGYPWVSR